jgi:hypothetical protein
LGVPNYRRRFFVKLTTRKVAVAVTALALAASSPVLVQADKNGVPHGNKPCPTKKKPKKHAKKKQQPNNKGKKCGWNQPVASTTTVTTVAAPVTTNTETTTTTTATP